MYAERADKCQSPIEKEFLLACCRVGLLVEPQYPIGKIHVDFAIPESKIAIECDGKEFHGDYLGTENDNKRDEITKKSGWLTIRLNGDAIRQNADRIVWDIKRGKYDSVGNGVIRIYKDPEPSENWADEEFAYGDKN